MSYAVHQRVTCATLSPMERISIRELRNNCSRVVKRIQAGETLRLTSNGVEVGQVGPVPPHRTMKTADLKARFSRLPRDDYEQMRRDSDELFGADRIEDYDPWERNRG